MSAARSAPAFGHIFAVIVSIVFALLLLSAVNTAIVDLIAIQFLMSRDRELPNIFQRLNKWGVPSAGMLLATLVPMLLVLMVKDMAGLADLYAVGVVGAIATNLGATSTDRKLSIKSWERTLMFGTFIVMAAIEMSLLIDKPNARYFAVTILAVGLILRGLVQERRMKKEAPRSRQKNCVSMLPHRAYTKSQRRRLEANRFCVRYEGPAARSTSRCGKRVRLGAGCICCLCASNHS